jgi:NADPH:quinone reductase-like Zn-dependent oxidoreductase
LIYLQDATAAGERQAPAYDRIVSRVVRFDRFGGPEVLRVVDEPDADPGPGEVRIALRAAGLNPADAKRRSAPGAYDVTFPVGVGRELAGIVEATGPGVQRLVAGDQVFGTVPDGAFAELLVRAETYFQRKPEGMSWEVAGGLALVGQTAWDALGSQDLHEGDAILVSAAAGGVGGVLSQLAVHRGIRVIGSASRGNHHWLRSRGVEPVEYGDGFVAAVRELAPDGVTAAFDLHGPDAIRQFLELGVAPERINTNATDPAPFGIRRVGRGPTDLDTLAALAALVVSGRIELPIAASYPFDQVRDAFERLETGHLRGKVVITGEAPVSVALAAPEP